METKQPTCVILGGGGHARVLIDCLQSSGAAVCRGVLDPDPTRWGQDLLGVPTLGGDDLLPQLAAQGVDSFVVGLGAVGNNGPRQRLFELGLAHGLAPLAVIHPSAVVSTWARLGRGVQLLPACVVNAGASLGDNVIVNSGAIVEHDCVIGAHTHVATGARLASTIQVGEGAHIGVGASVRQCIHIGARAVVGAGAVVVEDVPEAVVVVGVPARVLRRL